MQAQLSFGWAVIYLFLITHSKWIYRILSLVLCWSQYYSTTVQYTVQCTVCTVTNPQSEVMP